MAKMTHAEKLAYNQSYFEANREAIYEQRHQARNETVRGRMRAIVGNARSRAKQKGWAFNLSIDYLCALWEEQGGLCALTGEPMATQQGASRWQGNQVSLDRIDAAKGYVMGNVWLTTTQANYAKGTQTYEQFVEFCKTVVERSNA